MRNRVAIARAIGIIADVLQIGLFPLFAEGLASPLDAIVDAVVCGLLTWLVGWHFSFLPSFVMEGIPILDLAPTWTIAVMLATRKKRAVDPGTSTTVMEPKRLN